MRKKIIKGLNSLISNLLICILSTLIILLAHNQRLNALQMDKSLNIRPETIEFLKLHVPSSQREEWINAEKESWGPWLKEQKGFLGRQLFWNKDSEEAILLISWNSRSQWKKIPQSEIESVQKTFEEVARSKTGINKGNPFPLIYEGELIPQ